MQTQIQVFEYEGQAVEFDLARPEIMVNATEMAKIFGAEVKHFMENKVTQDFLDACLKTRNSEFLGIKKRDDLYTSKQRAGTWMHRVLALKFAAWLSPDFEVWVYYTINQLLQGQQPVTPTIKAEAEEIKAEKVAAEEEHEKVEAELLKVPEFAAWLKSEQNKKSADARLRRLAKKVASQVEQSLY